MVRLIGAGVMATAFATVAYSQGEGTFQTAVRAYVDLHRAAAAVAPSAPGGAEAPHAIQQALALHIQSQRQNARQGDILGIIAPQIRELVLREIGAPQGAAILSAIETTNVHGVRLRVNRRYPPTLPRVTMPAALLATLPVLPRELEYRFLGRSLLLVDADAGLVVDLIPDVLPQPRSRTASDS